MPEKTKKKKGTEKPAEKVFPKTCENTEAGIWSKDQAEKSYYYDDAYGYEIYNPEEDDNEPEDKL